MPYHLSYERGCQEKILFPPLAGDVDGVACTSSPRVLIRGVLDFAALARRAFQRRGQLQLLVPIHRFHENGGARRHSVPKLRKLSVGSNANHDPI